MGKGLRCSWRWLANEGSCRSFESFSSGGGLCSAKRSTRLNLYERSKEYERPWGQRSCSASRPIEYVWAALIEIEIWKENKYGAKTVSASWPQINEGQEVQPGGWCWADEKKVLGLADQKSYDACQNEAKVGGSNTVALFLLAAGTFVLSHSLGSVSLSVLIVLFSPLHFFLLCYCFLLCALDKFSVRLAH